MDAASVGVVDYALVWSKLIPIFSNGSPVVRISFFHLFVRFYVAALTLILVLGLHFLLIYPHFVQVHPAHLSSAVLEPEYIQKVVYVETILFGVRFEEL